MATDVNNKATFFYQNIVYMHENYFTWGRQGEQTTHCALMQNKQMLCNRTSDSTLMTNKINLIREINIMVDCGK